jgi:branched-chain amino acid transport system ATP-binding protein
MVAIARALMAKPRLLILDEPSWGLAPMMVEEVMRIVQEINRQGTTILLIEQNANVALGIADFAYVLDVGKIVIEGTGTQLLENEKVQQIYLGA